jgi:hypothetical protein
MFIGATVYERVRTSRYNTTTTNATASLIPLLLSGTRKEQRFFSLHVPRLVRLLPNSVFLVWCLTAGQGSSTPFFLDFLLKNQDLPKLSTPIERGMHYS